MISNFRKDEIKENKSFFRFHRRPWFWFLKFLATLKSELSLLRPPRLLRDSDAPFADGAPALLPPCSFLRTLQFELKLELKLPTAPAAPLPSLRSRRFMNASCFSISRCAAAILSHTHRKERGGEEEVRRGRGRGEGGGGGEERGGEGRKEEKRRGEKRREEQRRTEKNREEQRRTEKNRKEK